MFLSHPSQEFCVAMHLIGRVRKGLPLPDLPIKAVKKTVKKRKTRAPPATSKPKEADPKRKVESVAEKSPRRRSRLASLVECQEPEGDIPDTLIPTSLELGQAQVKCITKGLRSLPEQAKRKCLHAEEKRVFARSPSVCPAGKHEEGGFAL